VRIILALALILSVTACSTVAGMGQDIKGAAEWTHDKMTRPQPADPAK
jgi:predicted small secreted protein